MAVLVGLRQPKLLAVLTHTMSSLAVCRSPFPCLRVRGTGSGQEIRKALRDAHACG